MAIHIRLNTDLYKHYEYAMQKAKIEVVGATPIVELTSDNFNDTIKALEDMHSKCLKLKTKTIVHMERMYSIEQVLNKLRPQYVYFTKPVVVEEIESANTDSIDETEGKEVA